MPTYVAFLRAINLGAKRKFPKNELGATVEATGCTDVETYLNTGNVRLTTSLQSRAEVEAVLEEAFLADRGFEVSTIVFTPKELSEVAADAEELAADAGELGMQYVSLLKDLPSGTRVRELQTVEYDGERLVVRGRGAHLLLDKRDSYHSARLSNAWVEKRLGVATNRNVNVVRTLAARWGDPPGQHD